MPLSRAGVSHARLWLKLRVWVRRSTMISRKRGRHGAGWFTGDESAHGEAAEVVALALASAISIIGQKTPS
eukprot:scaffold23787_cov29-Tisochrysis_lutea.AAC.1